MAKVMINNINDFTVQLLIALPDNKKIKLANAFCYSGYYNYKNLEYNVSQCNQSAEILYKQVKATGTISQKNEAEEQLNGICKGIWRDFITLFKMLGLTPPILNPFSEFESEEKFLF